MAWWHDTGTPGQHMVTPSPGWRGDIICVGSNKQPGMAHLCDIVTLSAGGIVPVSGAWWLMTHIMRSRHNQRNVSIAEIRSRISTSDPSLTFLGHWGPRELLTLRVNDILAVLIIPCVWWPLTAPDRGHITDITQLWSVIVTHDNLSSYLVSAVGTHTWSQPH